MVQRRRKPPRAGYSARAVGALMRRLDVQTAVSDENRARNRVLRHTPAQIQSQLGNWPSAISPACSIPI